MNITPWVQMVIKKDLDDGDDQWFDIAGDTVYLESEATGSLCNYIRRIGVGVKGVSFILKPKLFGGDKTDEYAWDELDMWNHEKKTLHGYIISNNRFRLMGMDEALCLSMYSIFIRSSIMAFVGTRGQFPTMFKGVNPGLITGNEKSWYDSNGYPNEYLLSNLLSSFQ